MKKYISFSLLIAVLGLGFVISQTSSAIASYNATNQNKVVSVSVPAKLSLANDGFTCGDSITDRDGYTYSTVTIGKQCWMAENVRTKTKPDNTPLTNLSEGSERDCSNSEGFHGSEADCDAGNTIYTFNAAMNGSTKMGDQGLCPDGWHVPADHEWNMMDSFLKDTNNSCNASRNDAFDCNSAGTKLKIGGESGFNANLAGIRYADEMQGDMFMDFDTGGYFWTSTVTGTNTFLRNVNSDETGVWRGAQDINAPYLSASLRCVMN